jgi:hypothetical protein
MITVANKRHGAPGEYIGRPSPLGNPFPIGPVHGTRENVIDKYRAWLTCIWNNGGSGPELRELFRLADLALAGDLRLLCYCAPKACHGDVIKEFIGIVNNGRQAA